MKRTIASVSLVVGVGLGLLFGPMFRGDLAQARRRPLNVYRCIVNPAAADTQFFIHNLTNRAATFSFTPIPLDGIVLPGGGTGNLDPRETVNHSAGPGTGGVYELKSRSKLLVDAFSVYTVGAGTDDDRARQIRCT